MDQGESNFNVEDLFKPSDCEDALHRLYHFLDGELTSERKSAISKHLSDCGPCLAAFDFEAELKAVVGRSCREHAPSGLKDRIAAAIAEASESTPGIV